MKRTESLKSLKGQEQVEITFPYTHSKPGYSVSVKIYKTPRDGYDAFTLAYYQDGQRRRVLCNTFESAVEEADDVVKLLGSKDVDVLELRSADKAAYRRAREVLCCASESMIPFLVLGSFAGVRQAEIQRLEWKDIKFDDGSIEIQASKAKTASRRLVPIVPNLKEWLRRYRQPSGLVVMQRNASFELHLIAKRANQFRRATWATANGITDE